MLWGGGGGGKTVYSRVRKKQWAGLSGDQSNEHEWWWSRYKSIPGSGSMFCSRQSSNMPPSPTIQNCELYLYREGLWGFVINSSFILPSLIVPIKQSLLQICSTPDPVQTGSFQVFSPRILVTVRSSESATLGQHLGFSTLPFSNNYWTVF